MFEMTHVMEMGEQVVIPTLSYLFHRIEKRFDGRPTLLVLDECWLFLRHGIFASRLQSWLKTLRKRNVYVVFATQEPADAAGSSISPTIISACPTRIFLPDAEAAVPEVAKYYKTFGLTDAELHIIANAQQKRDYYYRSIKGRRLFTLDMGSVALAFAGFSNPKQQVFLNTIEKKLPPAAGLPPSLSTTIWTGQWSCSNHHGGKLHEQDVQPEGADAGGSTAGIDQYPRQGSLAGG